MTVNQPRPVKSPEEPGVREHQGLLVGAAAMMAAGFLTTFLSPLLAISYGSGPECFGPSGGAEPGCVGPGSPAVYSIARNGVRGLRV